ncbi:MAG: hypothetical protein KGI59_02955 [Patescibacteria group bacterium]|nr:hypothetical protein [Patescibacteria group bacterium]MDE2172665.1 hypothetical protein [Patescibacteria group bacterium]
MPRHQFNVGNQFTCKNSGVGVVLPDGSSFIIFGEGGRSAYETNKGPIPLDAVPLRHVPPREITFAMDCVMISHGITAVNVARF